MLTGSYWLSPAGKILPASATHIGDIISDPALFGFTQDEVEAAYKRHKEKMGQEGEAREELIVAALKRGWVRLRKYSKGWRWGCTIFRMTPEKRTALKNWAKFLVKESPEEHSSDVDIVDMADDGDAHHTTVEDMKKGRLNESYKTMLEEILG